MKKKYYYYLILFKDGTMLPFGFKPAKRDFEKGARFFRVEETVTILDIGEWYAASNPPANRFNNPTIVEIGKGG